MKGFFLSAGVGSRLRPYTDQRAKPAIPFLGIPLLHHVWHSLEGFGIQELVVNLHHRAEDVRKTAELLEKETKGLKVGFSDEQDLLLDSGGGLHRAQPYFEKEKNFALANGDEVFFLHDPGVLKDMAARHAFRKNLATLLVMENPEVGTKFGGAFAGPDNRVEKFSKTSVPGLKGWHYVGVMLLSSRIFQYMKPEVVAENLLYDSITKGIAAGEAVEVFPAQMDWYEVGNPKDFLGATRSVLEDLRTGSAPWADALKQRVRWAFLEEPLIENDEPALREEVRATLAKIKNEI